MFLCGGCVVLLRHELIRAEVKALSRPRRQPLGWAKAVRVTEERLPDHVHVWRLRSGVPAVCVGTWTGGSRG